MTEREPLLSDVDRAETERLLRGLRDATALSGRAHKAAIEAQKAADDAAGEVGRWSVAYEDHAKELGRKARRES